MSLRVAVQMDPLEGIDIAGDTTFALMEGAQARGHRLWEYRAAELTLDGAALRGAGKGSPGAETGSPGADNGREPLHGGGVEVLDLARDADVVLMRQDPPFDMAYITATHLLERIGHATLVVNDPAAVRNAPEKLWVLQWPELMPPTLITRSADEVRAFRERHGAIVVKPLFGNAGAGVFKLDKRDGNLPALLEMFAAAAREPVMAQAFLPAVSDGDKRIVLIDGEPAGAVNRIPRAGEIRSNLAVGGRAAAAGLTEREQAICAAIGPELKRLGLVLVGIDVIDGMLTEINVTSPTGIVAIDRFNGTDTPARFWDAVEARL